MFRREAPRQSTEILFDAVNGQYLKVAIGKGLISINDIVKLAERYAPYFMTETLS